MTDILAITICATEKYQYAMKAQARTLQANLARFDGQIHVILVGDKQLKAIADFYRELFSPAKDRVKIITIDHFKQADSGENYKNPAQMLIAQMRTAAFTAARSIGATLCWSLDSDVIPKTANCFRTLRWLLDMPGNYYDVAISPYPSQGGGDLLAGRGTPERPILPDFYENERNAGPELKIRMEKSKAAIAAADAARRPPTKEEMEELTAIAKELEKTPPIGNVFEMNSKFGWKRRGWLSQAYSGLGRGVIVPTDWCGFGNVLMNARALDECNFAGYEGSGTEDLYVVWNCWHQVGIRIGAALHEPSGHVSRRADGKNFFSSIRFVTDADDSKGECTGHLRTIQRSFYQHEQGEKYDPENDGIPIPPKDRTVAPAPAPEIQSLPTPAPELLPPGPAVPPA